MKYRKVIASGKTQWASGPKEPAKNKMATLTGVIT